MIAVVSALGINAQTALAASASEIDRNVTQTLTRLYQTTPGSEALADKARGVLVFPNILFIMDDGSLKYLDQTGGWELGARPSLVVLDKGFPTTTTHSGVTLLSLTRKD